MIQKSTDMGKYRISISENASIGSTFFAPIEVENFNEFMNYLKQENVKTFNLKYRSIMDDIPDFKEMGLPINKFNQEHFDWLIEENKWQSKSFEIVNRFKQSNIMEPRKENFKLGEFHGKLVPDKEYSEAKLRNDIFLIGRLGIKISRTETVEIKVIAKELPLQEDKNRGECIDILGIDKDWNPYVIELKLKTGEPLESAIEQVINYESLFEKAKTYIEKEVRDNLFYKGFKFSGQTKLIVLAEKEYFKEIKKQKLKDNLYLCSFYGMANIGTKERIELLERKNSSGIILLSKLNK